MALSWRRACGSRSRAECWRFTPRSRASSSIPATSWMGRSRASKDTSTTTALDSLSRPSTFPTHQTILNSLPQFSSRAKSTGREPSISSRQKSEVTAIKDVLARVLGSSVHPRVPLCAPWSKLLIFSARLRETSAILCVKDFASRSSTPVPRPGKELKGFVKVPLNAGETRRVSLALDRRAFAYYNIKNHDWTVDTGEFNVYVGSSSAKIELTEKITR